MKCQCLIASYHKDFEWLIHCLTSLKKFSRDFLPPVISVDSKDHAGCVAIVAQSYPEAIVKIEEGREGQGFMRAQLSMMSGDLLCPDADFVFLVGSDCIATSEFRPDDYFAANGKPIMLMSSYAALEKAHPGAVPWKPGVTRVLKFVPKYEYMRRLPIVYPKALFPALRAHVEGLHGKPFADFIYESDKLHRNTSESNLLGAYAHKFMPDIFEWVDIGGDGVDNSPLPNMPNPLLQLWSHGGLDRPADSRFVYTVTKSAFGRKPRDIINEIVYGL